MTPNGAEAELRTRLTAPRQRARTSRCTSPAPLKQTGRVMVKDEDLCVHCGLCAERCPTAAWDMQKFDVSDLPHASRSTNMAQARKPSARPRKRFRLQDRHRERHRFGQRQPLLMKAIFRMGVPVTGKNYFPSNIQGLPTWYEIRVSKDGYIARSGRVDLMVALNAETYAKDVAEVRPGGCLMYDSTWPLDAC